MALLSPEPLMLCQCSTMEQSPLKDLACKAIYERIRSKGKPLKVAMIAVINKMIRQLFAVVKSNTAFDNKFEIAK